MTSKWILFFGGLLDIAFGALLLLYPAATISFVLLFFGIYAVLYGITLMVAALAGNESSGYRWWLGLGGLFSLLVGIVALFYRAASVVIFIYFIAFRALFVGFFEFISSIQMRKVIEGEFLLGLAGVLNIIFGLFIIFFPLAGIAGIVLFLGWYSIILGLILVLRGLFFSPKAV